VPGLTIDPSVGGVESNSYGTVDEADAYFAARMNGLPWLATSDVEVKQQALITATNRLDQEQYRGKRASDIQALAFPRTGIMADGFPVAPDVIPPAVKYAEFEEALALIIAGTSDVLSASGNEGIQSVDADGVRVVFRDPHVAVTAGEYPLAADDPSLSLPEQVYRLLRNWITTGYRATSGTVRLVRS
jgi:hypothetical protein